MTQFSITHAVTLDVEAETQEDAEAQAAQWHGHVADQQYEALAQMTSVTVTSAARIDHSMSTGA